MKAAVLVLILFSTALVGQTLSEVNGNIVFTDAAGGRYEITSEHLDSEPTLCSDHRKIAFVRSTPNRKTDTGLGDIELSEIWIANRDRKQVPERVLSGHPGAFTPGQAMVMAGFSRLEFSPDCQRVYFSATTWATSAAFHVLDLRTGETKFLYAGLALEVIKTGRYKGFLIGTKNPITEDRGRVTVYWLLDANGNEVKRIGEDESGLAQFRRELE